MRNLILALILFGLLHTACKEDGSKRNEQPREPAPMETEASVTQLDAWLERVNDSTSALADLYAEQAILLFPDGTYLEENEAIEGYYRDEGLHIESLEAGFQIATGPGGEYHYETGEFQTRNGATYDYLWIFGMELEALKRQLEFLAVSDASAVVPEEELRQRRNRWMELCNSHQVSQLVLEMYRENGVYYNHKPVIVGQPLITEEYGYMQNPNYNLELRPLHLNAVSESMVIEIGQASGSYNGNYLLVWQKDPEGEWRILFDSNI